MKNKNRHGSYSFDRSYYKESIHILRFSGAWNIETAYDAMNEQEGMVSERLAHSAWAGIADMRQWEASPPEVIDAFNSGIKRLINLNFRYHAMLPNQHMKSLNENIADKYMEHVSSALITCYFNNEEEAIAWGRTKLQSHKAK